MHYRPSAHAVVAHKHGLDKTQTGRTNDPSQLSIQLTILCPSYFSFLSLFHSNTKRMTLS